nr:unnamed protein product [Callosobruchus analis]
MYCCPKRTAFLHIFKVLSLFFTDKEQLNPELADEVLCPNKAPTHASSLVTLRNLGNVSNPDPEKVDDTGRDELCPYSQIQSSSGVKEAGLLVNSDDSIDDPDYENSTSSSDESQIIENSSDTSNEYNNLSAPEQLFERNVGNAKRILTPGSKTLIEAKSLGPPCKDTCRFKCSLDVTAEQRRTFLRSSDHHLNQ